MSRSFRKSTTGMHFPLAGATSEKEDKKQWHGSMRAQYRANLAAANENSDVLEISPRQVSNVCSFAKDGHRFWSNESQMRLAKRLAAAKHLPEQEAAKKVQRNLHKFRAK